MMPEIIAHRGASYLAPENTLTAFRKAMEIGADGVEMDVQQTGDKKLVIHHDFLIDWHTDMRGQIYDMTMEELKALDFGSWKDVSYKDERIATLQEALALCREMEGTVVQLELKATIDNDPDFVPRVIEEIRAADITDRLVVISFNHDLLRQAKQLMPELKVGVLVYGALETMALPTSTWEMLGLQNGLEEDDFPQLPPLSVENVDDEIVVDHQLFIAGLLYVHFHAVRADLHRLAKRRKGIFRRKIGRAAVCNDLRCHKFQFFLTNLFFRKFQARSVPFEAMTFLYQ